MSFSSTVGMLAYGDVENNCWSNSVSILKAVRELAANDIMRVGPIKMAVSGLNDSTWQEYMDFLNDFAELMPQVETIS
jgi:hypothetical protein